MKTESLPTQDSDAAGSTGARSERAVIHHNSDLSQHLKQYLVAQLQDKNAGQPNQAPAGFSHQAPQASSSDYHLPPADKIIHVKLSAGETTFHVPANTTFDTIRIVGHDLVLVQKDGTAIVLEDAGDKIPNIEIGDVDVPKVALEAAFTANGIQAAEGPSGNPSPSSGGDFEDARASTLGNARGLTGFLGAEGFNFTGTSVHYPPPPLPQIALNANAEPTLRLSEAHLTGATNGVDGSDPDAALTTITGDFSVDFTPTPDVNGGVVTYALSIQGGNGTASGFIDSQTGLADVLVKNGNTIEGHVGGANGALAFTISVNPNTGVVTFTEDRAVSEAQTGTNPSANIATMSSNVVTLTATITDGLGHQASAGLDLGKQISLTDDGPGIVADAATVPELTLSEADLTAATNNGVNGSSPNTALTSVTGHFAGDFTDTSGADGLKSTTYALSIAGGTGTASGLVDSQTGQADVLVQNGNTIEGHVGSANGALAFTITLDPATGDITFTESRAIENNNTGSTGLSLAAGVVTLTQTLIDNDGTPALASIDLGAKLAITDDGPSIVANAATAPALTLSEADLTAATNGVDGSKHDGATTVVGNYAQDFTDTSGADGLKSTTYALSIAGGSGTASGLVDSQTGQADVLVQNGNTIEGHVGNAGGPLAFMITVDPATGDITFTEDRAVVQAQDSSNPSGVAATFTAGVVTLTQTLTDNDGTTASASIDLGGKLSITDDGPSVTANATTVPGLTLSETHLTAQTNNNVNGSSPDATQTVAVGHFAGDFTDVSGADGLKSTTYALSIVGGDGTASGLIDSQTGSKDVLVLNGNTIEGHVGSANGALAFTIAVDPATGDITFTEDRAVENNNTGSTGVSLSAGVVTLTQTITDNDGTVASANVDLGPKLSITDDGPSITTNAAPTLTLNESNLTFFTNGINGTDPDLKLTHTSADFSKAFNDTSGADGLKSAAYALSISHQGVASGLTDSQTGQADILFQNGNTITGFVGHSGIVAFTITIDPKTGELTFTEDRAVVQTQDGSDPSGNAATLASGVVTLTQTITDNDGTTASASVDVGSNLSITDDGPKISTAPFLEPGLVVSESHLTAGTNGASGSDPSSVLTHASGNFSFSFVDTPGADGLKSIGYTLTLGNGGVSGLVDSQTHQNDVLVQTSATTITGYVGSQASGIVAFTISVDPHTGIVAFTEDRAVVQAQNGHDPSQDLASFASGAITLTQTLVDNDGTTTSASLDIGKQFAIADDGPSISVSQHNEPALTVSEVNLQASTNGVDGTVHNGAIIATGNFSGNFNDTFGADGAAAKGPVGYALSIGNPAPHSNVVLSGLVDSQTHQNDVLIQVNATTIEGHVGSANGALAFTISVDAMTGVVTFTEDRAVVQQQNGQDPSGDVASLTNGAVVLTQAITDGDGTTTSASLDISQQLQIKDDGPSIVTVAKNEPTLTLSESNLTSTSDDSHTPGTSPNLTSTATMQSFSGVFADTFGADGAAKVGSASYALSLAGFNSRSGHGVDSGLVDTLTGQHDYLFQNGNTITAYVGDSTHGSIAFTITLDPSSGNITFTEDRSVENNGGSTTLSSGLVTLQQTITDGDGTSTSASVNIGSQFSITDDTPQITLTHATEPVLTVHEADLQASTNDGVNGTIADGKTTSGPTGFAGAFSDNFGADGAAKTGSVSYALSIGNNGATSLVDTLSGTAVTLHQVGTAEIDGRDANGDLVFTLKVDASGEVSFTLDRAVGDNSGPVSLPASSVVLTQTITDGDGTQTSANVNIGSQLSITDDKPTISLTGASVATQLVSESHLPSTTDDNYTPGTLPATSNPSATENFSGAFSDKFGADGPESGSKAAGTSYALTVGSQGTSTGLIDTLSGDAVTLKQVNTTEIDGIVTVSGQTYTVFTYVVDSSGQVTFTLERSVENNGTSVSLPTNSVTLTQTLTDGDGSTTTSAGVDISKQFSITDDTPTIAVVTGNEPSLTLSETFLPNGTAHNPSDTSVTKDFTPVFSDNFGADGQAHSGAVSYALSIGNGGDSGLKDTLSGQEVTLVQKNSGEVDGVVTINDVQTTVFTVTVDGNGHVTFTEDRTVENNNTGSAGASLTSSAVVLTQTITDGDGTQTSASANIGSQLSITDDGPKAPVLTVNNTVGVDETPGAQTTGGATDVLYSSLPTAIAALFAGLTNTGTDTNVPAGSLDQGALSFAASGASLVSVGTPVFGADGAATSNSETYALKLEGTASGLTLTDGTAITLSISNGMIIGTAGTDSFNSALSGKIAFAIAIDSASGEVYVAQYLALHQPTASNPNDVVTLAANSVGVTVTLTDGDGTQSSTSSDVSTHVQFYDDGPSIAAVQTAYVGDVANSSFNGTWQPTFGADGPSLTVPVSLAMGSAPAGLTYNVTDTVHQINGHEVFEVQVTGTASYTFFEYTSAAATGTEMFAFTDQAGQNPFFILDVLANGTYSFDLEATNLPGGGKTITFASGGEHDFFYSANGSASLTAGDYNLIPPNFGVPGNYGVLITAGGAFNDVGISNGKMGVDGNQLNFGEELDFAFGATQTQVTIGVAAGEQVPIEQFEVTIWNAAHTASHTETLTQTDGTAIVVDQANWQGDGSNTWFAGGISEVDVINIATRSPEDNQVSLTSVSSGTQSASVPTTTLDFDVGATDGDGDGTTANLAVNLVTPPAAVAGSYAESVSESGLPTGSSPNGGVIVDTVQVSFTAGTDNAHVTLDPSALTTSLAGFQGLTWQVVNGVVEGFQGSTEVVSFAITSGATIQAGQTGTVTMTETLLAPIDGDNGGTAGDLGTLNVVASDVNNPSINATDQVTVGVLDDKPIAVADVAADTSGQALSANVITGAGETSGKDTPGADGGLTVVGVEAGNNTNATVTSGVGAGIVGTYGTLTLAADGSYTYTANPDTTGLTDNKVDTFTYTVKDADGSPSTTTLAVNVNEVHPTASVATGTVYEAGLSNGSHVGTTTTVQTGTLSFSESGGDTVTLTSVNGQSVGQSSNNTTIFGAHGALLINENGSYTYTLTSAETGSNGVEAPDTFTYTATDSHGNTNTNTLTFAIVDDKPVAVADVAVDASGQTLSANVITGVGETSGKDTAGADGGLTVLGVETGSNTSATVTTGIGTAIAGTYGTLTLAADGSYSYVAKPDTTGLTGIHADTFTYTIKDADGSTSTTTLTLNTNEVQPTVAAATGTVYEAGLSNGSQVGTTTTVQTGTLSFSESTVTSVTIGGTTYNVPQDGTSITIATAHSTLVINEHGAYTYTLTGPETGSNGVEAPDTFTYVVTDAQHNTNTSTLTFSIVDDKPVADADAANATVGQTVTADVAHGLFGTVANGGAGDISGADSPASVTGVVATSNSNAAGTAGTAGADGIPYTVTGAEGTLTLNGDGSYSYVAKANATPGSTDTFTYTITDADGSPSTNTLTVTIAAPAGPDLLVFESGLNNGFTGSDAGNEPTMANQPLTIPNGDSAKFDSSQSGLLAPNGYEWLKPGSFFNNTGSWVLAPLSFGLPGSPVLTLSLSGGVLTETLLAPIISSTGTSQYNLGSIQVDIDHNNQQVSTQTITLGAADDAPQISNVQAVALQDFAHSVSGNITFTSGADGFGNGNAPASLAGNPDPGITVNGQTLHYWVNSTSPNELIAYVGNAPTGNNAPATNEQVFTLTLNETSGVPNGTYTFDLLQPAVQSFTPSSYAAFSSDEIVSASAGQLAIASGGTFHAPQDNWSLSSNHSMTFSFTPGADSDTNFSPVAEELSATFNFAKAGTGDSHSVSYTVDYLDGTSQSSSISVSSSAATNWTSPLSSSGAGIESITFTESNSSKDTDTISVLGTTGVPTETLTGDLSFNLTTTDADGSQGTGTINVDITGNDLSLGAFNGAYTAISDSASSHMLIGDSSNDIFIANFAGDTMQAHSATSGNNIFEIANISNPSELITNFNSTNDVIDLTQLLSNVNTSAQGFNISNYVEYLSSSSGTGTQAGELLINENGGGFGTNHTGTVLTVATIDTNVPNSQTPATHPTAVSGQPSPILIAYQDQSHLVHSVHAHTG